MLVEYWPLVTNLRDNASDAVVIPYVPVTSQPLISKPTNEKKRTSIVSTVNDTVLCATGAIGAKRLIPCVTSIAVGRSADVVRPAPVGVKSDGTRLLRAAVTTFASASLPGKLGVILGRRGSSLLSAGGPKK